MKCPHCEKHVEESAKFCRGCGTSLEPVTRLLDNTPPPAATAQEQTAPSYEQAEKPRAEDESHGEEVSASIDLKEVGKASVKCAWVLALSALLVHLAVTYLAGLLPPVVVDSSLKPRDATLYFLQAGIAGFFILFIFTPLGAPRMGENPWDKITREAFHQFLKGWSAIWVSWLLLYLYFGLFLSVVSTPTPQQNVTLQVTVDFLNIANSAAFFYVFLVLDMPSVRTQDKPLRNKEFQKALMAVAPICSAVFLFSAFCRFNHLRLGPLVSGLLVGTAMAYVFGRLDSHHMNVNRWTLAPLYLYAMIQATGPDLIDYRSEIKEGWQKLFFATALLLKVWLFIVVNYWLQNGSFAKYFNTVPGYIEGMRLKERGLGG